MYHTDFKRIVRLLVLLSITGLVLLPSSTVKASDPPVLPEECSSIAVGEGNKLAFHVYARGVQLYKWNGSTWDFVAPVATLYAEENFFGEVGTHYVGPKWESKSGSIVEGRRVLGTGCTPDPTAIAWLKLSKFETSGSGIFSSITFIQRVNTTGGLPPTNPGTSPNEVQGVPYTAEYYFYRAEN